MRLLTALLGPLLLSSALAAEPPPAQWRTVDLRALPTLETVAERLTDKRVVYIGETHDAYAHHLGQLAIIKRLHAEHPDLAIGVEQFQQPFQAALDAYIAGEIDDRELLIRSEWFERWKFDWRLYRPIFQFAREQRIPVIALNVPAELTRKVAEGGFASLSQEEQAQLPEVDRGDLAYRERLLGIFGQHPGAEKKNFEHFYEAQLLWDEGMAERVARWLSEHPERPMVVLAGNGHLQGGSGIPKRVARRVAPEQAVVLNGPVDLLPEAADYVVLPPEAKLPDPARLGILMEPKEGKVLVADFDEKSPAKAAGIKQGDRLLKVNGREVAGMGDVRLALLDAKPGDTVPVTVLRTGLLRKEEREELQVTLR